jgi:hypothetical protein
MVDADKKTITRFQGILFKALKATIKSVLLYGVYFVLSMFLSPISEFVPNVLQAVEAFVAVYICLIIVGEFVSGTVFKYFFDAAKALFVILFLTFSLKGGVIAVTFQDLSLMVDIRLFLMIAILLSLLGFAKSVLQAISFLNQKAEHSSRLTSFKPRNH